jgi:hypothetical protein
MSDQAGVLIAPRRPRARASCLVGAVVLLLAVVATPAAAHNVVGPKDWYAFSTGIFGQFCGAKQSTLADQPPPTSWYGVGFTSLYAGNPCIYPPQNLPANTVYVQTRVYNSDGSPCSAPAVSRTNTAGVYEIGVVRASACGTGPPTGSKFTQSLSGVQLNGSWYYAYSYAAHT